MCERCVLKFREEEAQRSIDRFKEMVDSKLTEYRITLELRREKEAVGVAGQAQAAFRDLLSSIAVMADVHAEIVKWNSSMADGKKEHTSGLFGLN